MFKQSFIQVAACHFAKALGVSEERVEELYDFVNTHFTISVQSTKTLKPQKPEKFFSTLIYLDTEAGEPATTVLVFRNKNLEDSFPSKEEALELAYSRINDTVFYQHGNPLPPEIPNNVLLLFDKDYNKQQ